MKKIVSLIVSGLILTCFFLPEVPSAHSAISSTPSETLPVPDFSKDTALPPELYPPMDYFAATVEQVVQEGTTDIEGSPQMFQIVKLKITSGEERGKVVNVTNGGRVTIDEHQLVKQGEHVVIVKSEGGGVDGSPGYYIGDKYRLPPMIFAITLFLALIIYFGRTKGFMSIIGLMFSVLVLIKGIIPLILAGYSPIVVTLVGSCLIAVVSIFLAHGFNKRTVIAVWSTLVTLSISIGLAFLFVMITKLFGGGSEQAAYLRLDSGHINLQGLLLGGIIIGTLGVLDDITTAQVAVVHELREANSSLSAAELYRRGSTIGREHIASLVNTLVLAYAGASLPLFLMFTMNSAQPFWVTFNSEFIAEEVIRTLIGSMALILGVPISTWFAARYLTRERKSSAQHSS